MSIHVTKSAGDNSLDVYSSGALIGAFSKMDFRGPSVDVSNNANSGTVVVNVSGGGGGTDATKYAQSGETRDLITSGGIVAQGTFSGKTITITSGLIAADVISGNINAGLVNAGRLILPRLPDGATSGEAIVAQGTGLDPVWAAVTTDTSTLYTQSGETRNLVTSGGIFAMGGYLSGAINADLVNAGRLSLSRLPDGSTSGHALQAQGSGIDPLYAAQVVTDTSHLYAQSGETRDLVTSGGIFAMGGYLSGAINAGLVNAGSFGIARMPQGSTSGQVMTAMGSGTAPAYATDPTRTAYNVFKTGDAYNSITQGTWAILMNTNQWCGGYFANSSKTLGDRLNYKFSHKAGSFTLCVLGFKNNNIGKFEVYVDGTLAGTIDEYAAAAEVNVVFTFAITLAADGEHTMHTVCIEKNTSSSDYWNLITSWWIRD